MRERVTHRYSGPSKGTRLQIQQLADALGTLQAAAGEYDNGCFVFANGT